MGKGDRAKVRWKNDRIKKKKARDRRRGTHPATAPPKEPAPQT